MNRIYIGLRSRTIDDDVAFEILRLAKNPALFDSQCPAHLLNLFEFEASRLSNRAKDRCRAFLREWGDEYTHVHTVQVIAELRKGRYLDA